MAVAGLYKRPLPCPPAVDFASPRGKELFAEALSEGTMNGFFRLISTFQTQAEPAYCGLSSLSVVLNALSIDPGRKWKGPWRWFDESMLDCCEPLEQVKKEGITFAKVTCLAQCAGALVKAFQANQSSLDLFRSYVEDCASSDDRHLIVSYDRQLLEQTGSGHFSPLGGYHRQRDMALILDVARFKYPPHWVPLSLLWSAMNTIDYATGKPRGFMMVYKREVSTCFLFTLSCKDERWRAMCKHLLEEVPQLLKTTNSMDIGQVIHTVFDSLPASVTSFVKWIVEVKLAEGGEVKKVDRDETERLHYKIKVLEQLRQTAAFVSITKWMEEMCVKCFGSDSLQNVIMQACCQGAAAFTGIKCLSNVTHIEKEDEAEVRLDEDRGGSVVLCRSKLMVDGCEQVIAALVPKVSPSPLSAANSICQCCLEDICQCCLEDNTSHPTSRDLFTILLLALPMSTWDELGNPQAHSEMCRIVSREGLPLELQLEVEHLWEQASLVSGLCTEEM